MDLLIIVLLMFVGGGLGTLLGLAIPAASPEAAGIAATLGGVLGAVCGYGLLSVARSIERGWQGPPPARAGKIRPAHAPVSFRTRMARFAGKPEQEVLKQGEPFRSSMPFWSAVEFFRRVPPKSAAIIRRTLLSIRRTLRR